MDELISRKDAIDKMVMLPKYFDKTGTLCLDYADVLAVLSEHLPSAEPEIITCKECRHRPFTNGNYNDDEWDCGFNIEFPDYKCPCQCTGDNYYNWLPDDNWFCGNAERKNG